MVPESNQTCAPFGPKGPNARLALSIQGLYGSIGQAAKTLDNGIKRRCSQGRTAWQERERGRRCSLSEEARQHRIKQTEAHHRWMKRNRIHDATFGGGSDEDDDFVAFHQSAAANALLYVGLGTTAIGSVIFFVGTGEKGFKVLN
ncbi:hypothetical protein HUJ04_007934 [Dendroctonus ponderosae]|nr:hypothetical protein HUJ04_007934 [Dendroctonus ponderosae]